MSDRINDSLVDTATYDDLMDKCMDNVVDSPVSSFEPIGEMPRSLPSKSIAHRSSLTKNKWFLLLAGLCLLNLAIAGFSQIASETALSTERATQQRMVTFGADSKATEAVLEFMMSDKQYSGPNDPAFQQDLSELNVALEKKAGGSDHQSLEAEDFQFKGKSFNYAK